MHYLITGHTGFKGSWMTLMLKEMGHTVSGVAIDPEPLSLFHVARVSDLLTHDLRADIRKFDTMRNAIETCSPDVLIHMAAQPLVREGYRQPHLTLETNVMGTANVLASASVSDSIEAQLIVTTDKVYRNTERAEGYREEEPLGGDDPYSVSKAMADILTHAWATSFGGPRTAVARAGNVIGGGDYSRDRLVPDVVASIVAGRKVVLRYPNAVRPWQHVLDCLAGYLSIIDHTLKADPVFPPAHPWNIGPGIESFVTVRELTTIFAAKWGVEDAWTTDSEEHPEEAAILTLDTTRAQKELGWSNRLNLHDAVGWTADWYQKAQRGDDPRTVSLMQVSRFLGLVSTG